MYKNLKHLYNHHNPPFQRGKCAPFKWFSDETHMVQLKIIIYSSVRIPSLKYNLIPI